MVVDGPGDVFGFALRACVKASDDSLQLGELANHFRNEIALREFGGAVGAGNIRVRDTRAEPLLGQPARNGTHSFDFVGDSCRGAFRK